MIIEKSKELLEKLRRTNYKRIPDFGMDEESEMIIKVIINECKSTLAFQDQDGEVTFERYGSDIIKENIEQIVRQLILNGVNIPRETMKNIMCSNNEFITGIDADIPLYKGIQEQEDGSMNRVATTGNVIIDFSKLDNNIVDMIKKEVYDRYARCFILDNKEKLPHLNKVSIFKERVFHGRENKEFINRKFSSLLKRQTNYNDEIIKNTVKYHLENLYSDKFKQEVLQSVANGNMLVPIEKNKVSFNQLLDAISAEVQDIESLIPDINNIQQDIAQIYADIEAQLIGYSTDITKLSANEIENTIKDINEIYLKNSELEKYSDKSGYRIVNVGINNENVKMVEHQNVPFCMKRISEDIQELVQSASKMNKDDYLKRAVQLNYRFIRIHPFVDSNGRTSRALLNMMTIPKGMLIEVPKERKNEFIKAQRVFKLMEDDHVGAYSAQCAYYTILSFIPFIILVITLIQYTGIQPQTLFEAITKIVPESMNDMVLGVVEEVYSKSIGTISISIIFTIWSAGKGLFALTSGLQNVYKIHTEKHVSYLYLRLKVFIETIIFIILIVLGLTLLVFGDSLKYIIQQQLEGIKNYNVLMSIFTQLVFWIITFVIFLFIYKFIPKHDMSFKGQIYGAVFGSIALNVISFIFSKYLYIFKGFSLTYGSLTTLMLIMMWTYACFYTVLLGAEINKLLGIMHKD